MGNIHYNDRIIRNSENLIIFTGYLTTTLAPTTTTTTLAPTTTTTTLAPTTTTTTLAPTTTTTTTLIPMVIRWVNGIIYTTNSLYPGYFRSLDYVWNAGDNNNFMSGIYPIPNLRFYWEFKSGQDAYSGTLKTSAIEPSGLFNGLYFTDTIVIN